jgi:AraC-like DNA-binding protein
VYRTGAVPQIVGPLTRPTVEVLAPGSAVVGVRFYPGAAASVLGAPASELADLVLTADEIWGRSALAAGERWAEPVSPREAAALLQQLILRRVADAGGNDPLVSDAVRRMMPRGAGDVGSVASSLWVSERHFRRRFHAAVGVGPKTLHRMLRFQGFLARAQRELSHGANPAGDGLAKLATDAGYADQPHLTRECLRLTGLSSRAFLRQTEQHCGASHDHETSFARFPQKR